MMPTSRRQFLRTSAVFLAAAALPRLARAADAVVPPRTIHPYPNKIAWGSGTWSFLRRVKLAVGADTEPGVVAMMKETWDHVNGLAAYLEQRGRRAIMWGDALLGDVSHRIVIADWHYDATSGDVPTLGRFRERGFETLACPWNGLTNIRTMARAAVANQGGFLMTTWHHLPQSIPALAWAAGCAWSEDPAALGMRQYENSIMRAATASHLRHLVPADGRFERAGWNPFEQPAEVD